MTNALPSRKNRWLLRSLALGAGAALLALGGEACMVTVQDDGGTKALTVSPSPLDGLTCEAYDFTATGATGAVTWSIDPNAATNGAIDEKGHYTAPIVVPASGFNVVATSGTLTGKSAVTLHTAHPTKIGATNISAHNIEAGALATSGDRLYTASVDANNKVNVARSEDAGKTWGASVVANDTAANISIGCVSVAIDAGNPDVVYVTYQALTNGGPFAKTTDINEMESGSTVALAVSEDKGATWKNYVLISQNNEGFCSAIASPSANTVTVETPTDDAGGASADMAVHMYTFVDNARGSGFTDGALDMYSFRTNEIHDPFTTKAVEYVSYNGGDDGAEYPTLAVGPEGKLCVSFWTSTMDTNYSYPLTVSCSPDGGKTFGDLSVVTNPASQSADGKVYPRHQRMAFGSDGKAAIVWDQPDATTGDPDAFISTSADGTTWSAPKKLNNLNLGGADVRGHHPTVAWEGPILWISYQGKEQGLVVDKSCDGGTTWSGNQPIDPNADMSLRESYLPFLFVSKTGAVLSSFDNTQDSAISIRTLDP